MSKVKICGLSRVEDVYAVNREMPDFIGFVFAESRRRIDEMTAAALREKLDAGIETVGVFVNQETEFIADLYKKGIIDLAQLHGDEDSGYIERLRGRAASLGRRPMRIIKAIGIGDKQRELPAGADYLLFDTASEQRGGMGKTFDWDILRDYGWPPYFLAGGLTISNVASGIELLAPFCVDVSSGVETDGVKDAMKITEFIRIVREAS